LLDDDDRADAVADSICEDLPRLRLITGDDYVISTHGKRMGTFRENVASSYLVCLRVIEASLRANGRQLSEYMDERPKLVSDLQPVREYLEVDVCDVRRRDVARISNTLCAQRLLAARDTALRSVLSSLVATGGAEFVRGTRPASRPTDPKDVFDAICSYRLLGNEDSSARELDGASDVVSELADVLEARRGEVSAVLTRDF
jgi:hypothetical protein